MLTNVLALALGYNPVQEILNFKKEKKLLVNMKPIKTWSGSYEATH